MDNESLPIEIPFKNLSMDALEGVIDNFIQREGTDYGTSEVTYETKLRQVQKQIEKGDVVIVFDPSSESVQLLSKNDFRKLTRAGNA